jgi:MFS family permease
MVNEWWVTRRGLAWGIIAGASGASGAVFPFIVESLLKKYGYRTTLRALAMAFFLLTAPLVPFFKPRIPPSQQSAIAKTDWSFLSKPLFWVYCTSNVIQGFGFYFPSLYLPSYASSIGLSTTQGALLLALMSMAQLLGQFTFGFLSDGRVPLNVLALVSTIVAGVASFALWGLARSLAALVVFALVYGFFGYAYVSMRARMGTAVTSDPTGALATFGLFCFGQGVGNVLTGPIGGSLLSSVTSINTYGLMKYRAVVIFTGSCMVLSALSISSWYLRPRRVRAA